MSFVNGKKLRLYLQPTGATGAAVILHARKGEIVFDRAIRDIRTKDLISKWRKVVVGAKSVLIRCEALVYYDTGAALNNIEVFNLFNSPDTVRFEWRTDNIGDPVYYGEAIVTELVETGAQDEEAEFSFSLKGAGAVTRGISYEPPDMSGYEAEYKALIDYAIQEGIQPPTASVADAQNSLVASLKDDGLWELFEAFYVFDNAGLQADFALLNWGSGGRADDGHIEGDVIRHTGGFASNGGGVMFGHNPQATLDGEDFDANHFFGVIFDGVSQLTAGEHDLLAMESDGEVGVTLRYDATADTLRFYWQSSHHIAQAEMSPLGTGLDNVFLGINREGNKLTRYLGDQSGGDWGVSYGVVSPPLAEAATGVSVRFACLGSPFDAVQEAALYTHLAQYFNDIQRPIQ